MKKLAFLLAACIHIGLSAEPDGSVCVVPPFWGPERPYSTPGLFCEWEKISIKIDGYAIAAPIKKCTKIAPLDVSAKHRVIVLCDGKPQQSGTFRFSKFKTNDVCVFMNDFYKTLQFWPADRRAPWCKCK